MTKETFHKTWYYRLLQVVFWGSLILFSVSLMLLGVFESDVEISGFFWSAVLAGIYWFTKRIFYYVMFGEKIFPRKNIQNLEKEITAIHNESIADSESIGNSANVRGNIRDAKLKKYQSSLERKGNGWKSKIFWKIIVAILVAVIGAIIVTYILEFFTQTNKP